MAITQSQINNEQLLLIMNLEEDHFKDLKSKEIKPAKLSKSVSAFANAVGCELYIGIRESDQKDGNKIREWIGFTDKEEANSHIQLF